MTAQLQPPEPSQPRRVARGKKYWALQGVRSLQIELERSVQQVTFQSMGVRPQLRATLLRTDRFTFLSFALAIITAVWGIAKTNRDVRRKTRFVLNVSVLAVAVPVGKRSRISWPFTTLQQADVFLGSDNVDRTL